MKTKFVMQNKNNASVSECIKVFDSVICHLSSVICRLSSVPYPPTL